MFEGRLTPFLIRHLPVSSFPQLPANVAGALNQRGCMIPQTYEAHGPENVVHASLERAASSDCWHFITCRRRRITRIAKHFWHATSDSRQRASWKRNLI